jgi:biopolymer transport protein ExbD
MQTVIQQIGKRLCAFVFALTFGFVVYSLIPVSAPKEKNDYSEEKYLPRLHIVEVFKCAPKPLKPNPNVLSLKIYENGNLNLYHEEIGSLAQPTKLKNELSRIFNERERVGIFKKDSAEVDKTVTIRPAASVKFSEIIKLIEIVEETGANTVQFDPEYCNTGGGSG